ncbi:Holliday junction branch migration protein RuvA [Propionispora hippei]|uniref:Holliday junction branch migration complex subunit RuvA n=1 Tax=Propionispora hippei DSM 15287 TaxID=1123003 RepID=A0A1M6AGZ5_9FIRM|nr:Holliday junction branch migration protein RuvA [Propionispora hippei]SHI35800.1 Holliday junction DNA helicase subunit RuvA [Propionispora hippei DSM 15287]
MIGYLRGVISHLMPEYCLLDVQGVGYRIFIAGSTRQKLSVGVTVSLFTYMHVREDALLLYGFSTQDEYDLFIRVTSVSGIGPKVAMGILSACSPTDFRLAVASNHIAFLTKLPGIGKKTAERIVLELKDKLGAGLAAGAAVLTTTGPAIAVNDSEVEQALQALVALGYNQNEIMPVLKGLDGAGHSAETLIRLALKEFVRR